VEIVADIELGSATKAGLRVRCTPDTSEHTLIGYDRTDGTLFSDTTRSSQNQALSLQSRFSPVKKGPLDLMSGETLRLHIYVDASVIETFANERAAIIDRIYPSSPQAIGIGAFAVGGSAVVGSLEVWNLRPISSDRMTSGPLEASDAPDPSWMTEGEQV
jgi:sucrose-6-phosphate hydrolase SacC (GH32 family)